MIARPLRIATIIVAAGCTNPSADPAPAASNASQSVILGSCCGADDASIMEQMRRYEATPEGQRPPEVALVPYRATTGITTRERLVIDTPEAWTRVWSQIVASHGPKPALPRVDFEREIIVVAAMGQRSSGGYTISIDSATRAGDAIILSVTERSPGRTCGTTAALTAPVALARLSRQSGPIRFSERTATTNCE